MFEVSKRGGREEGGGREGGVFRCGWLAIEERARPRPFGLVLASLPVRWLERHTRHALALRLASVGTSPLAVVCRTERPSLGASPS